MKNLLFFFLLFFVFPVWAEKADREKPMLIEADSASIDDKDKIQTLTGNVVITKGTIRLEAHKVLIKEDEYGYQHGTAYQFPHKRAYFRQKREGLDEYIEGKAERIVYDGNAETAELVGNAWVKSGKDEVSGAYIRYNAMDESYFVGSSEKTEDKPNSQRVKAIIQPRNKGENAGENGNGKNSAHPNNNGNANNNATDNKNPKPLPELPLSLKNSPTLGKP